MLIYEKGNIFESQAAALVNPVNTEGVMGKGLAFQFKKKFPENFSKYFKRCKDKSFDVGTELVWTNENNRIIINFPTKRSWRENSKIEYIQVGLKKLEELINELEIKSIAIPPIGAGNGKLDWDSVLKEIKIFQKSLKDDVEVEVYTPSLDVSKLSKGHFLITITLLELYKKGIKKAIINDLFLQKIIFLGDKKNYFKFEKQKKGPFSNLINIQYNEMKNYCRIRKLSLTTLKEEILKEKTSFSLQMEEKEIEKGIDFYLEMKNYLKLENKNPSLIYDKIELLGTIIYLLRYDLKKDFCLEDIYKKVITWNKRKKMKFTEENINEMVNFLIKSNRIEKNIFGKYHCNNI